MDFRDEFSDDVKKRQMDCKKKISNHYCRGYKARKITELSKHIKSKSDRGNENERWRIIYG